MRRVVEARMRRFGAVLVVAALALALFGPVLVRPIAAPVSADSPVDIRGTWSGLYHTDIGDFANSDTFTTEDFTTGVVSGVANDNTYTLAGTVTGNKIHWTAAENGASYVATSDAVVSADGTQLIGTGHDTNGRSGTFTFARQTPVPSASVAAAPSPSPSSPSPSSAPIVNAPGVVPPIRHPAAHSAASAAGRRPRPRRATAPSSARSAARSPTSWRFRAALPPTPTASAGGSSSRTPSARSIQPDGRPDPST